MRSSTSIAASFVVLSSLAAVGCAADAGGDDIDSELGASVSSELGSGISVPNPSGAYVASVTANGTGCPSGTWNAKISRDGKSFEVAFSNYEAVISDGQSFSMKECTVAVDLRSPRGLSFAARSFKVEGAAELDSAGMKLTETSKYYFQGNPVPGEHRNEVTGPFDDSLDFSDNIAPADLVWSPCGTSRRLNAQTRVTLQNNRDRSGAGSVAIGSAKLRMRFDIAWRTC